MMSSSKLGRVGTASRLRNLKPRLERASLNAGENLLEGLDMWALGYECHKHVAGGRAAAHVFLRKRGLSAL